jgi:hypothetical protein
VRIHRTVLVACVALALSPACGGCIANTVISPAELDQASVVVHGSVVSEVQVPGTAGITDTFQVDALWKGSSFPNSVTYTVSPCEPAREGVLVLSKSQADMARANGHIDGDMRAYDAWAVLDAEPTSFRLTHDPRVWVGIAVVAVFMIGLLASVLIVVVAVRTKRRAR